MKQILLILIPAVLLQSCAPSKNDESGNLVINDTAKQRIDSTLKALVDAGSIAGVSALVFEKNKEAYFNSFGYADLEAKTPMERNTLVRIYSMTKPVTGAALMTLFEKGAFQLDDPLSKYTPEFEKMKVYAGTDAKGGMKLTEPSRPITIRDITRHTAGFPTNPDTTTAFGMMVKKANVMNFDNTLAQMAQKLGTLPLDSHPGEKWAYGISVDVQAFLVERLSGKPYEQYLQETILDPLKMNSTRYVLPETDRSRFAAMYRRKEDGKLERVPDDMAYKFNYKKWPLTPGGFGLTATIDDYMRFARMLVNEGTLDNVTILKPETIQLMATNHLADSVTERMFLPSKGQVGFGIDFAVRTKPPASTDENNGVVGEFFWDGFASTLFWVDPVNELTAVLFVQIIPFDNALHKKFRDAVYGKVVVGKDGGPKEM
jgi:CubicO group peptidase (beta-lactamase class C family)